jgi:hypothetical protein
MTLRLLGAAAAAWIVFAAEAPARTWTDSTDKHSIEADLVDVRDGTVRLKKENGNVITLPVEKLSDEDQKFLKEEEAKSDDGMPKTVTVDKLAGQPKELANDDGKPAGQKSFPRGHASAFDAPEGTWYLTSVRIHGARYGLPAPPKEDFHVTLCDERFHKIADFAFPYSKFPYGSSTWVTLKLKPTKVPKRFVLCLDFNAKATKGVYISHDAEGESLVGLPEKHAGSFTGGDWLIRPSLDQLKQPAGGEAKEEKK